jgi:hypothetical protein
MIVERLTCQGKTVAIPFVLENGKTIAHHGTKELIETTVILFRKKPVFNVKGDP